MSYFLPFPKMRRLFAVAFTTAYTFPDKQTEFELCRSAGVANLSVLAGPLTGATAGEALLIVANRMDVLEAVSPHLTWLRRGPLYADARAGSVELPASNGSSFRHTTVFKLRHDIEQFEYLAAKGWHAAWLRSVVIPAYERVADRATTPSLEYYELDDLDVALVGTTYNRALLFAPGDLPIHRLPAALSSDVPWATVDRKYQDGGGLAVVYVDDALAPDALANLLEYCRSATLFFEAKVHGAGAHLGAYVVDGFAAPLLLQVVDDLRAALPSVVGDLPIKNIWAYKYTHDQSGIAVHKDAAKVNVNLWISPDAANLEPNRGGLKIFDDSGTLPMERSKTPLALDDTWLADLPNVTVPFKQNRLTIFDSALPHRSDIGQWQPGYLNRRISITFLFGDPTSNY